MSRRSKTIFRQQLPLDWTPSEVATWLNVAKQVQAAKDEGRRIVLVSGVFDLFHSEHQHFLQKARACGNFLVVALESDSRVRQIKGPDRPVDEQERRVQKVESCDYVDIVAILPEQFDLPQHHRALIELLKPHILAVSEHTPHQFEKKQLMTLVGGQLQVVLPQNKAVSTSLLIENGQYD